MDIYDVLELPMAARIDRVVPKKQFYDNGDLSSADKKLFDYVEKIYWRYALKTENSFIQPYRDEEKDYPEIEVLEVNLRAEKQLKRLAEVIIHAIPYPMLLFFTLADKRRLYMGKLRKSQARRIVRGWRWWLWKIRTGGAKKMTFGRKCPCGKCRGQISASCMKVGLMPSVKVIWRHCLWIRTISLAMRPERQYSALRP